MAKDAFNECVGSLTTGDVASLCTELSFSPTDLGFGWMTCCELLRGTATSTLPDSAGITPPPSTAPAAPPFHMETWMGNRTGQWAFMPSFYCEAITEAVSIIRARSLLPVSEQSWDYTPATTTQTFANYQNNLTYWDRDEETRSRWCRPELYFHTIGEADFWYPGSCPSE